MLVGGGGKKGRRKGEGTVRIRRGFDGVKEAHVADIVEVDLLFKDDDEALSVETDGEDGGRKGKFANGGLPLV